MSYNPAYGQPGQVPGGYPGQQPHQGGYPSQQQHGGYPGQQPQHGGYPGQQPQHGGYPGQPPPAYGAPPVDPTIAAWFQAVDQDKSGQINSKELRAALQNGNWSQFSEESCRMMIAMFDHDRSGSINVQEFSQLFNYINQWTEVYKRYDQNRSGTIDERELGSALQQMGYRLTPQFVSFLVSKFSPKQRQVTLDNFIVANVQIRNLTESFKAKDREMKGVITISYEDFMSMALSSV